MLLWGILISMALGILVNSIKIETLEEELDTVKQRLEVE